MIAAQERGKKQIGTIYFSRQWWSLGRTSLQALLDDMERDEHLVESFRFCVMSDELMFATLYQLRYPGSVTLGVPMFDQFIPHTRVFHNEQEMAEVRLSHEHLFMRKIHPDRADLVEMAAALGDKVMVSILVRRVAAMLDQDPARWREGDHLPRGWHVALFTVATPQAALRPDGDPIDRPPRESFHGGLERPPQSHLAGSGLVAIPPVPTRSPSNATTNETVRPGASA